MLCGGAAPFLRRERFKERFKRYLRIRNVFLPFMGYEGVNQIPEINMTENQIVQRLQYREPFLRLLTGWILIYGYIYLQPERILMMHTVWDILGLVVGVVQIIVSGLVFYQKYICRNNTKNGIRFLLILQKELYSGSVVKTKI